MYNVYIYGTYRYYGTSAIWATMSIKNENMLFVIRHEGLLSAMNTSVTFHMKKRVSTSMIAIVATIASLCLLLLSTVTASANTVNVYDNSGVLNASDVKSAASSLPYAMDIYTIKTFNGSTSAFDQQAASHTANNANLIVMAIDTVHRHLAIKAGSHVPLSSGQVQNAISAFKSSFGSGDYTGASKAAISSLQSSLSSSSSGNGGTTPAPAPSGGLFSGFGFSTICCIGLLVLAGLALFAFFRRRSGGGFFNRRNPNPVMQDPYANANQYNQPYNQGYPPPGYGQGYNQPRQGLNPWAAGGLGAAAGGLAGYELGRMQGEHEGGERDQNFGNNDNGGNDNNAGNFGGGASGDFGGGNDGGGFIGDAGGGGGGDFGGGGGGGDFGGGGGGNF